MSTLVQVKTEKVDDEVQNNNYNYCTSDLVTTTSTFDKITVRLLISFVAEIYDQLTSPYNRYKKKFWEQVVDNFNEKGYTFGWQQLQKKWNNLVETYRNNVRKMLRCGRGSLRWEFFDSMERIVGSEQSLIQDWEEPNQMFMCSIPTNNCSPPRPTSPPCIALNLPAPISVPAQPVIPVLIPFSEKQEQVIEHIETCSSVKHKEQISSNCVFTDLNEDVKASSSSSDDNEEEEVILRGNKRKLHESGGRGIVKKQNEKINVEILKELRTLNSIKKEALEQRIQMFNEYKEINQERNRCLAELSASIAQIANRQLQ